VNKGCPNEDGFFYWFEEGVESKDFRIFWVVPFNLLKYNKFSKSLKF
jgi:hypothetical protein